MIESDFTDWYDESFNDRFDRTLKRVAISELESEQLARRLFGEVSPYIGTIQQMYDTYVGSKLAYTGEDYKNQQDTDLASKIKDGHAANKRILVMEDSKWSDKPMSLADAIVKFDPNTLAKEYVPANSNIVYQIKIAGTNHSEVVDISSGNECSPSQLEMTSLMKGLKKFVTSFGSISAMVDTPLFAISLRKALTKEWSPISVSFNPHLTEVGLHQVIGSFEKWYTKYG